MAKATFSARL